jgi:hypothetical protein
MKIRLFLMVFCVLLCVGELSAQKHVWTEVPLPDGFSSSLMGTWYVDYSSIRRLPDGNVTYWAKGDGDIFQTEVDCVAKKERTLKKIQLAMTDNYGNETRAEKDVTIESDLRWGTIKPGSMGDKMSGRACSSAKNIVSQPDKPVVKKKVVKGTRKRKQ